MLDLSKVENIVSREIDFEEVKKPTYEFSDFRVDKLPSGFFKLTHTASDTVLYDNLLLFSAALAIARYLDLGDVKTATAVAYLEEQYHKHTSRSRFHKHTGKFDLYANEIKSAENCVKWIHSYLLKPASIG